MGRLYNISLPLLSLASNYLCPTSSTLYSPRLAGRPANYNYLISNTLWCLKAM
nr:MAG TPA: hypothetical protein [Crassvirales sp.]